MVAARDVAIVRTGIANLASVIAAFERLGARPFVTTEARAITEASHVMLPGVGAFGAGMGALSAAHLVEPLSLRVAADRPTMAICLGLQLLCETSDETPGVRGLGLVPAHVARFTGPGLKVPQLGWNRVVAAPGMRFIETGYAYFANSYRLGEAPPGFSCALADHGGPFVAALERDNLLACQFHPELSGPWGQALIARWLEVG